MQLGTQAVTPLGTPSTQYGPRAQWVLRVLAKQNRYLILIWVSSVQLLSHVQLFVTPWTVERQASLSITNSQSLLKLMSIEL